MSSVGHPKYTCISNFICISVEKTFEILKDFSRLILFALVWIAEKSSLSKNEIIWKNRTLIALFHDFRKLYPLRQISIEIYQAAKSTTYFEIVSCDWLILNNRSGGRRKVENFQTFFPLSA